MRKLLCCLFLLFSIAMFAACGEDTPEISNPDALGAGSPSGGNSSGISAVIATDNESCAVEIGDYKLNTTCFCYYYYDAIATFYDSYSYQSGIIVDDILDSSKPLNEQMFNAEADITWADYFVDLAFQDAKEDLVLYDLAQKDGWTLPEAAEKELDSVMENIATHAAMNGYPSTDSYLRSYYDPNSNTTNYRAYLRLQAIADGYYTHHRQSLTYDVTALRNHEDSHYDDYTSYSYDSVYLNYTYFPEGRELMDAAARELATAKTLEELKAKIDALQINVHPNHVENMLRTELSPSKKILNDWITAADRKAGDVAALPITTTKDVDGKIIEETNGYYVVIFNSKNENKTKMGNVRHLLVKFEGGTTNEETGETVYSDADKATAQQKAQEYLDMWTNGAADEAYFIELVKRYSQDTYLEDGGLFENIHKSSGYVEPFENWAIDPARQPGETGIVETEYGYHVMYFVGWSKLTYRDYLITNELASADQTAWYESALAAVSAEVCNTVNLPLDLILLPE